jgi:hypothetical protein
LFIFMCHFIDWRARAETISSQSARKSMWTPFQHSMIVMMTVG